MNSLSPGPQSRSSLWNLGRFVSRATYTAERARREELEFLYDAALILSGADSADIPQALERLLTRTLTAFGAEVAEIVFLSPNGDHGLRATVRVDGRPSRLAPLDATLTTRVGEALLAAGPGVRPAAEVDDSWLAEHLRTREMGDGLVAVLGDETQPIGALMLGGVPAGVDADIALLHTLAANTAAALSGDRLGATVWQLHKLQDDLRHQAAHDPLTDLANRPRFLADLSAALAAGSREAAVIFVDVDDFKMVNDTLGHAAGDALLLAIAGRLRECVRAGDTLARLGGDEFVVLAPGRGAEGDAVELAERIDARLDERFSVAGGPLTARVSIGVAVGAGDRISGEELMRNAELAMHRAKDADTSHVELFSSELERTELGDCELRRRLRDAALRADFKVHYQPIVDLGRGTVAAREALVRWQDGPRGPVHPASFIPIAEEMGVIVDIGRQILRRACVDAQGWDTDRSGGPAVHVNLSPVELHDPDFLTGVDETLGASGLDPYRLVLEITERVVLSDPTRTIVILKQLRELGVRIALDDFGSGYSSLSQLRWLPLDTLKIGRPFVEELERSDSSRPLLRMLLELATSLGLEVIAEGIETRAQMRALRALGCGYGQGFFLGSPAPAAGPAFPADELEMRLG